METEARFNAQKNIVVSIDAEDDDKLVAMFAHNAVMATLTPAQAFRLATQIMRALDAANVEVR